MTAAQRGHRVTLFDRAAEIGGQLNMAKQVPGKEEFWGLVDWYRTMMEDLGVQVELNREVAADDLTGFRRGGDRHRRHPARSGDSGAGQ